MLTCRKRARSDVILRKSQRIKLNKEAEELQKNDEAIKVMVRKSTVDAQNKTVGVWKYDLQSQFYPFNRLSSNTIELQRQHIVEKNFQGHRAMRIISSVVVDFSAKCVYSCGEVGKLFWQPRLQLNRIQIEAFLFRNCPKPKRTICESNLRPIEIQKNDQVLLHGTISLKNAYSIFKHGFDASLRKRQAHGPGEYFSYNFDTARRYGKFILVCLVKSGKQVGDIVVCPNTKDELPVAILCY